MNIIGFTIGVLLIIVGAFELIPALLDYSDGNGNYRAFLECAVISVFFGGALIISNDTRKKTMNPRQTFLMTTFCWVFLSLFASFPLYMSDLGLSFTDAFFESVSGVTTTGSTVLTGLDDMSRGVLLWRSIIQWIGGIGIIAFAIVVLPFLKIGGMQLFQTENSDKSEKAVPRTVDLVWSLIKIYCLLTGACIMTYYILGMGAFDAVNHALTTIPTGGYSTHDASFGYFKSPALHYACAFFMLLGGIPFVLYVKFLFHGKFVFFKDDQLITLLFMLIGFVVVLSSWLWMNSNYTLSQSIQYSVFNIISVITTTGYATTDYTVWGGFAATFFFFITFLGACAGSTSGGIKMMRIIIAAKVVGRQIKTLIYPRGIFSLHYQNRTLDHSVTSTVMGFLGLFVVSNVILTVALSLLGLDFETAVSASATALANVGPGIGDTIGPAGNFSSLPDSAKWLLSAGMLLGRLEIITVLILFRPEYWKF